jgi:D-alanyl-D-alanine carboxypeptidase (penicillin-binding protein 5/6)
MEYSDNDELTSKPRKPNTNLLLGHYDGIDGLKTGTLPSKGFHFAATAGREGTRFVVIVMGILDVDYIHSMNRRADEARLLLDWAFANYGTWYPSLSDFDRRIPVKHGTLDSVSVRPGSEPSPMTLPRRENQSVVMLIDTVSKITAPVSEGQKLGNIQWYYGGRLLSEVPLIAEADVERRWRFVDALGLR